MKQEATGAYYTAKINGRWWLIDPLGYPMYLCNMIGVVTNFNNNANQLAAVTQRYGNEEKWAIAAKFQMQNELGFNSVSGWSAQTAITEVPEAMPYDVTIHSIVYYGVDRGIARKSGSSVFDQANNVAKNTMPVFDPEYVAYAEEKIKEGMQKVNGNSQVLYYQLDNEIPMDRDMLYNYLTLNAKAEVDGVKVNMYSYACAWTWFRHMTGQANPPTDLIINLPSDLKELFRGFVYDRYYAVTVPLCKKYDDGTHLCAGVRYLTGADSHSILGAEWVVRATAYWTDIISINWYSNWTPSAMDLYNLTVWSGDMPFVVSEFNARVDEVEGGVEYHQESTGGGWYVKDYADQAAFYENFMLRILEWKNNIGYCWYRYSNYWVGDTFRAGEGIIRDNGEFKDVAYSMQTINKNIYGLIDFLDERQKVQ